MVLPATTAEHSAFTVPLRVERAVDLTRPPLNAGSSFWTSPFDYRACQRFAGAARSLDAQLIRYRSVRDPASGANVALLDPSSFATAEPSIRLTLHVRFEQHRLVIIPALPGSELFTFSFEQFGLAPPR